MFSIFRKQIDYRRKYEDEKARADKMEIELVKLINEMQELVNGFSIFRGRNGIQTKKHHIE
tara:strand:- start:170 stop:352 length:183 start_codon:yes stop_codon:yes gene_type:complete